MEQTYSKSIAELEQIINRLRSDNCDVDQLTELTKRAATLLKDCRRKLTTTEEELAKVLSDLENDCAD